jgi:hypothetical protein
MWYNPIIKALLRSPLHFIASDSVMLLKYTGHRSGKRYSVPVSYARHENDLLVITQRRRKWWRSLVGGRPVEVRLRGIWWDATAEAFTDPDRTADEMALYLEKYRYLARHMGISLDDDGKPERADMLREAERRIMVRVSFPEREE